MRAALIPSKGLEATALLSDIHLVLAQELYREEYLQTYVYAASDHFLILDNGAYEGAVVSPLFLMQRAVALRVNEVVIPDDMGNADGTIAQAKKFFHWLEGFAMPTPMNFMAVLQSTGDAASWQKCITEFAEMPDITTIGIPRHFVDKDRYMRYQVCAWIKGNHFDERFNVHLLGTNPKFVTEIATMANAFPWIRSCDSSLPYNYTIAGKRLGALVNREERPDHYFTEPRIVDQDLLAKNINTYKRWASGTEGTTR